MNAGRTILLTALIALTGCQSGIPTNSPSPAPRPSVLTEAATDTPDSAAARAYYGQVQQALLSQGLLRTDGGGADTPYTDTMLARNFTRIALYDEYARDSNGTVARETSAELRRWQQPVRVAVRFGASVSSERRATDTARVGSYLGRLAQVTGHSISLDDTNPNFFVYFVSEDERRALGPTISALLPDLTSGDVAGVTSMPRSTYCIVLAQSKGNTGVYQRAFAVIRSEHPDLLRLSCIHEEIAQGLGLPNDSALARPSIFNDDEEFALLTSMDEAMLRMLYNPALRSGMNEAEARPIIDLLARRLAGGES